MIGFFNSKSNFSLATIQALSVEAAYIYGPEESTYYPTGGIPSGEGSGIYTYDEPLVATVYDTFVEDTYHYVLTQQDQVLTIENKHVDGDPIQNTQGDRAAQLCIKGTYGLNQTVVIKGCKFSNADHRGLYIKDIDNVIVEGNYFDTVKQPMLCYYTKSFTVRYNKIRNNGVGTWSQYVLGHVINISGSAEYTTIVDGHEYENGQVINTIDNIDISYNLIDRSNAPHLMFDLVPKDINGLPWTDPGALDEVHSYDRNAQAIQSDYINLRRCIMTEGSIGRIHNNIIMGSEYISENSTGCGFILDHLNDDIEFAGNMAVNATNTAFGCANSGGVWKSNYGHYTNKANRNLTTVHNEDESWGTGETWGQIDKHSVRGFGFGGYLGHHDGDYCEYYPPFYPDRACIIQDNRVARISSDGTPDDNGAGSIDAKVETYVDGSNPFHTILGNSFGYYENHATYPIPYLRDENRPCEIIDYFYYFDMYSPAVGAPLPTSDNEIYQLVCDEDYSSSTNWIPTEKSMFSKWGTANNHEVYFNEGRVVYAEDTSTLATLSADVAAVTEPTRFIVTDASSSSSITLIGNAHPVWIEAQTQDGVILSGQTNIAGDDIVVSKFKFTGDSSGVYVTGNNARLYKNTFDNAGLPYHVKTSAQIGFTMDYNTVKNKTAPANIIFFLQSYADDVDPSGIHVHHNYFVDLDVGSTFQPRLRESHVSDTGIDEYGYSSSKVDDTIFEYNYFLRCGKPMNGKQNNIIFRNSTVEASRSFNFRAGANGSLLDNYMFDNGCFDAMGDGNIITGNYFEGNDLSGDGCIEVSNGGLSSSTNARTACTNVDVSNNYFTDADRGVYFGRRIDYRGAGYDIAPSGNVINNYFNNFTNAIYINSAEPLMSLMTTTPNDESPAIVWDMSGQFTAADVANGIVGTGS